MGTIIRKGERKRVQVKGIDSIGERMNLFKV